MTLRELAGILPLDYDGAVARFGGNEALYGRFLNKFLQDGTYDALKQAVAAQDYDQVERQAHTLKGVTANLGLQRLSEHSDHLVQAVRQEARDQIMPLFSKLQEQYQITIRALTQLSDG